jgi:hypothetical protein
MSDNHPSRREALIAMTAAPFLAGALEAQADASSVCFASAIEMAQLIRAK